MDNMIQKVDSFIGKDLLDMLMFSMYPDAKIIYREYVQNAFDSINSAVEEKVLNKVRDGIVSIKIDPIGRNISIKDNGTGIPKDYALKILTSIADSQKDGVERAGVYGIGRLVGAGYCSRLEFRTSSVGEDIATIVNFDVDATRSILDNKTDRRSATEVMNSIVSYQTIREATNEHYFEVILHNVRKEYPILLSEEDIIEYLKEVAPIDYEMPFKNNVMFSSFDEDNTFEQLQKDLKYIKLSVNNQPDIRKRYSDTVVGTGDEIVTLQYFSLDDIQYGRLAWGWFAVTKFSKAIPASDPNRGIRLRKLNIQIGEANYLNQYFDEARGNNYFYGEIHAVHPNLRPNTSRAGLTPTVEANILFKKLNEYFKQLKFIYNLANKAKTAVRDITQATTKIGQQGLTEKEKKEAEATLSLGKKKLESATKSVTQQGSATNPAAVKILQQYQQQIIDSAPAKLSVETVQSTGKQTIIATESVPVISAAGEGDTAIYSTDQHTSSSLHQASSATITQDIFQPLVDKLPKEQVWIVRRIFKSLSDNCPKAHLSLIEDLKKLVIKDLEK